MSHGEGIAVRPPEAQLTEVPEHLLQRSRDRRSALGLGGGDSGIAAAAAPKPAAEVAVTDSGAAPAATAASAAPATQTEAEAKVEPVAPYVEAGMRRRKIPVWAMPVLAALPIWAIIYAGTLDKETPKQQGPLALGTEVYTTKGCSGCHGASGGGGSGPAMTNLTEDFPNPADQLYWVMEGSDGFKAKGLTTYGTSEKPVKGGMPGWAGTLTADELIGVIRHEREAFAGDKFDATTYDKMLEMVTKEFPDRQAEFKEAIDAFKLLPSDA